MNMMTELKDVRSGHVLRAKMRVAGTHVGGDRSIEVRNPYTGALVGTVPKATVDDIRREISPLVQQIQRESRNEKEFNERLESLQDDIVQNLIDRVLIVKEF